MKARDSNFGARERERSQFGGDTAGEHSPMNTSCIHNNNTLVYYTAMKNLHFFNTSMEESYSELIYISYIYTYIFLLE